MCGIVGYIGTKEARGVLIDCLSRLEYRGYDSCGIAVCGTRLESYKDTGRVSTLKAAPAIPGTIGIGHTRWATHGPPSAANAHPHLDCSGKIAVVHNGIINNYLSLKTKLIREGHVFVSETDTEVIPHLIEKYFDGDLSIAVRRTLADLDGSFAIAVLMEGQDSLVAARKNSPLIIGVGDGENFIASDVPAVLNYTTNIIYLEDGDTAVVSRNAVTITQNETPVFRRPERFSGDVRQIQKNGYEHFMLKEIHEQTGIIRDSLNSYTAENSDHSLGTAITSNAQDIVIIGCGTSYHAGLVGRYLIEKFTGIPVRVELGSEFSHCDYSVTSSAAICVTQSGETADILTSIKRLKAAGVRTAVITNTRGSTATRLGDEIFYTRAGPELSVAATKSFIAQLIEFYKLVLSSKIVNETIARTLREQFVRLPGKVEKLINNQDRIIAAATELLDSEAVFFIGRGINYPIALEGALKLKEIAYIPAEGYAAGELKHGPFALLDEKTPVIAAVPRDGSYNQMISSIKEISARKAPIIALVDETDDTVEDMTDCTIRIPGIHEIFSPVLNAVALQLLAYHTARLKGCPIDFPKNLAKSVTVE